jgi:4-aminobutyrate aminotransferase-like enzyme
MAASGFHVGDVQAAGHYVIAEQRTVFDAVVRHLAAARERWRYLLFVDEVQTGMYRTGPFCRSAALDLRPDLMTLGKGTSDMMVPFALALLSDDVAGRLAQTGSGLEAAIEERSGYEIGYRTVVNVLRLAEAGRLSERVGRAAERFADRAAQLAACRAVRAVRTFGLLIGIELETRGWPGAWLRRRVGGFYLLNLLRHRGFPVLAGFCQYEPHVLKLTPPLTVTDDEIDRLCDALGDVLRRRAVRLVPPVIGSVVKSSVARRRRPGALV